MRRALGAGSLLALAALAGCGDGDDSSPPELQILSSDPAVVTGGDALVSVAVPSGTSSTEMRLSLNGSDVTSQLQYDGTTNSLRGVVTGMRDGANTLVASAGSRQASLVATNYPIGGPVFSGPQVQPWVCTTEQVGLGAPLDAQCNAPSTYKYYYKSVSRGDFQRYDPATPPSADEIASTTTDQGVVTPYIVRVETGALNRSIYEIAVLADPSKPWSASAPQAAWNGKVYIPLSGGFGHAFSQARVLSSTPADAILNDMALKRGFLVTKTTFLQAATHLDWVRGAESLMMLKERIRENYGAIRYTFSSGASGGSMIQNMIVHAYPGLLQGIIPTAEYADLWSTGLQEAMDCIQLYSYFSGRGAAIWPDATQRVAVYGHLNEASCNFFGRIFPNSMRPTTAGTGPFTPEVTSAMLYHPVTNPSGARGSQPDFHVNYLGRRPSDLWTPPEMAAGFGFGLGVFDNVGVQFGLKGLLEGRITAEQFVHLNEQIGGLDIDLLPTAARHKQDPQAGTRAYRMGFVNDMSRHDQVAIISVRLPDVDPTASHSVVHSFFSGDRLAKAGHSANRVLWIIPGFEASRQHELSFLSMDRWLGAVEADKNAGTLGAKIARNKPADVVNGCWAPDATSIDLANIVNDLDRCTSTWYPVSGNPRVVAANGSRDASLVTKCQLKPLSRGDYAGVTFSEAQWARLEAVFPGGVCDWSKPDAAWSTSLPWLGFAGGPGGEPLNILPN